MPVRRVLVATTVAALVAVGACSGGSQEGDRASSGQDASVDERDLEQVLATASAVSAVVGSDFAPLDLDELETLGSDLLTSGEEACGTYLDDDYGPPEQIEVGSGLEDEFGVITINQYAKLFDDADQAQDLLDEATDLLDACTGFTIAVPAGEFEVTIDPARGLDDVAVDDADEVIGARLSFSMAGSTTGALFSIELRIVRIGSVAVVVSLQRSGAVDTGETDEVVAAVARRAARLGVGG